MNDCSRRGKIIGGCHFIPRYSTTSTPPTPEQLSLLSEPIMTYEIEALTAHGITYEGDVCSRCGRKAA